jgi:hypothetical protein
MIPHLRPADLTSSDWDIEELKVHLGPKKRNDMNGVAMGIRTCERITRLRSVTPQNLPCSFIGAISQRAFNSMSWYSIIWKS